VKVSLISTVRDAGPAVREFLHSVAAQTRPPDELVVVDGGSTDGTLEVLRSWPAVTLIEQPGANIATGRNQAIRAATHDVIAVSDADCVLDPQWLERLVESIERGSEVAMGLTRPIADRLFQVCAAAIALPEPNEVREDRFMPSSRSVAFRRAVFDEAGGYPEWLDIGEDMYLDHRWRAAGARMNLVPEAVVYWRVRPNLGAMWKQYFGYARGDGVAGLYPKRHALRFATYAAIAVAVASRRRWLLASLAAAAAGFAAPRVRRAFRSLSSPRDRALAASLIPALMGFMDAAKMAGYLAGLLERSGRLCRPS
jgi:glycosyltransferase involved in cell wall biosynthesis